MNNWSFLHLTLHNDGDHDRPGNQDQDSHKTSQIHWSTARKIHTNPTMLLDPSLSLNDLFSVIGPTFQTASAVSLRTCEAQKHTPACPLLGGLCGVVRLLRGCVWAEARIPPSGKAAVAPGKAWEVAPPPPPPPEPYGPLPGAPCMKDCWGRLADCWGDDRKSSLVTIFKVQDVRHAASATALSVVVRKTTWPLTILWLFIMLSNSSLILLYFSSVVGVRM